MVNAINVELQIPKSLPLGEIFIADTSSEYLMKHGFIMPVIIQTPSFLCAPPFSKPLKTMTVMALLDTGASHTAISNKIAVYLDLEVSGYSRLNTAGGRVLSPNYSVDILFPNAGLKNFENLKVDSCNVPFDINLPSEEFMSNKNFGVLIGRDMMSRWNIVWNGPTSTVFISD